MDIVPSQKSSRPEPLAGSAKIDYQCDLIHRSWDYILEAVQASLYNELYDLLADERSRFLLWEKSSECLNPSENPPSLCFTPVEGSMIESSVLAGLERLAHVLQKGMFELSSLLSC